MTESVHNLSEEKVVGSSLTFCASRGSFVKGREGGKNGLMTTKLGLVGVMPLDNLGATLHWRKKIGRL